jgi:hypothetical protein
MKKAAKWQVEMKVSVDYTSAAPGIAILRGLGLGLGWATATPAGSSGRVMVTICGDRGAAAKSKNNGMLGVVIDGIFYPELTAA